MVSIRRLTSKDQPRLRQFWIEHWGDEIMITRGNVYRPDQLGGFVIEDGRDWVGLLTFLVRDSECEVTSLDSLREREGIGTRLMDAAVNEARKRKCRRVFLITTNDNMQALRFYQKRGLELVAVHRGAVDESRKLEPSIPLTGFDGIPLRDEIELEMIL